MLLTKTVKVKWSNYIKRYYEEKGYVYTSHLDEFEVRVEDLSKGSGALVEVKCDCPDCKNPYLKPMKWKVYQACVKIDDKYYCNKCCKKLYSAETIRKVKLAKSKSFEQWCIDNNKQEILNRWDYEKNIDKNGNLIKPSEVSYSSNGINGYWFKCDKHLEHGSEMKSIRDYTSGQNGSLLCKQCKSFQQWCYDNLSKIESEGILSRWDYDKNIDKNGSVVKPDEVSYGTHSKYWFKCKNNLNHRSELKSINDFTNGQEGSIKCNQCNSFAQYLIDAYGEDALVLYWDYDKNSVNPWMLDKSCRNKVWIKCRDVEYHDSYEIVCSSFINGTRCSYCNKNGGKVHPLDSLGKLLEDKDLLSIWSSKNKLSPYKYTPNTSIKEVWWRCECGKHKDYKRKVQESNMCNFRCPSCVQERDESFLQEKVRLYLNEFGYTVLHEHNCNVIPKNPKTKQPLPFDNEVVELRLICEVHGLQHYEVCGWHKLISKKNNTTPKYELHYQKLKDRYKRICVKSKGYEYLEIPYWTDDENETWKVLIDKKIKETNINKLKEAI